MSISYTETKVVKGAVTTEVVAIVMGAKWKQVIKDKICKTVKLEEPFVYAAEWAETTKIKATVTSLAGPYSLITTFLESE